MAIGRDWHIDSALSEIAIGYLQEIGEVADAVAPVVEVSKQSDAYYIWSKADFFRIPDTKLERKSRPKAVEFSVSSATYFARGYALMAQLPYEDIGNADEALELETSHTKLIVNQLYRDYENRIATLCTCGTNLGSYAQLSGTKLWTDYANSDPIGDVKSGTSFIQGITGFSPNIMIVGYKVHQAVIQHPDIIDRIKYTARATEAEITNALADIFGVERYIVADGLKNTGKEGTSASYTHIWGNNVFLCYRPNAPGRMVPAFMYTFRWKVPKLPGAFEVRKRDNDDIRCREIECYLYQDEKIVGADLGYVINSVVP